MPHAHNQSPASKRHEYWVVARCECAVRGSCMTFPFYSALFSRLAAPTTPTNQNPTQDAKTALTPSIHALDCSASALAALSSSSSSSQHLLSAQRIAATGCGSLSACSPEVSTETDPDDLDSGKCLSQACMSPVLTWECRRHSRPDFHHHTIRMSPSRRGNSPQKCGKGPRSVQFRARQWCMTRAACR